MKVRMLRNQTGSNNGIKVELYQKDEEYEIGEDLGSVFIRIGACELIEEEKIRDKSPKDKAKDNSPKNKALRDSPFNKSLETELEEIMSEED